MDNKTFAAGLEKRTKAFAIDVVRLSVTLPKNPEAIVIRKQLTQSGTSIGANYREANRARSRADFISRIKICESEASETQYWLELVMETGWLNRERTAAVQHECGELLALFTAIGKTNNSFAMKGTIFKSD